MRPMVTMGPRQQAAHADQCIKPDRQHGTVTQYWIRYAQTQEFSKRHI